MRCEPAHHFTVAKARAWRGAIDDSPVYQRAGDAWTLGQQQRFIDSLLNGYDVPKIYLHDLRGLEPTLVYAVVDGKQRLTAIWDFLADGFPLADDFRIEALPAPHVPPPATPPEGALRFSELDPRWRTTLLQTYLSVVLIRHATEDDIDELFARLNDGTPLTAAERRNAIAGTMGGLVREVAARDDLAALLGFPDARGAYRDVAAAVLAIAAGAPDLSPDGLDAFVRTRRGLDPARAAELLEAVGAGLAAVAARLDPADPALAAPATAMLALRHAWPRAPSLEAASGSGVVAVPASRASR